MYLRFLQLQHRGLERLDAADPNRYVPTSELQLADDLLLSWEEAVDHELSWPAWTVDELAAGVRQTVTVPGAEQVEPLTASDGRPVGRVVRRRWPMIAVLTAETTEVDDYLRLSVKVENTAPTAPQTKEDAVRGSLLGAHLLLEASGTGFVSLLEPPRHGSRVSGGSMPPAPLLAGDGRLLGAPTRWSWPHPSSCTTIPRWPRRARAPCSTRPRSTRSSPCG